MNTNTNGVDNSNLFGIIRLSVDESKERKEMMSERNSRHHIPAIANRETRSLKEQAREELYMGSKLGIPGAYSRLNHRALMARYGRYQIKTTYDTGDMMWHIYLM